MRRVVFWSSFPFVLPQALRLRRTAPRFVAAAGPVTGSVAGKRSVRLIAIGDSIIAGVGARSLDLALVGQTASILSQSLGVGVEWQAIGSIGATSAKIAQQLVPKLPDRAVDFIVLSTGVNDLTSLMTLGRWRTSLDTLLAALHRHSPGAIVAVAGIPPLHGFPLLPQPLRAVFGMRGRSFDAVGRRVVAAHDHAVYVPLEFTPGPDKFSPDGFHPSEASYADFGAAVAAAFVGRAGRPGPAGGA
ncbi:SGNH/GDSL hydrolase family protein [Luteimonas salinilitoris]|uniref:SGNH/GDSL hydrolase family protein n=1 Tax=Luteimonas salinilitoris TaxID=3237697 RepID=A0ABV4HU97_9GAMM